jgi:hypothetical protein
MRVSIEGSFGEISPACRDYSPQAQIAEFEFQKRAQHFIGTHDETLSVAVRVNNPE